jgi:hypothetical protein
MSTGAQNTEQEKSSGWCIGSNEKPWTNEFLSPQTRSLSKSKPNPASNPKKDNRDEDKSPAWNTRHVHLCAHPWIADASFCLLCEFRLRWQRPVSKRPVRRVLGELRLRRRRAMQKWSMWWVLGEF